MVRPKKHLGQHFLTDKGIAGRIVDALGQTGDGTVIEVGPGTGILTGPLLEKGLNLVPVEIDPESVSFLVNRWPLLKGVLIEGDFLKLDLDARFEEKLHVIGNFPYYISSQIFFKILENRHRISTVVCMLQKEVAERITSAPGSRTYGILSVLVQAFYRTSYLFSVKPGSFHPPPKVSSGVIRLERNHVAELPCDESLFFRVVKTVFNQRRKMIRNSIKPILLNLDSDLALLSKRPEQLDVQQFIDLTLWVESRLEQMSIETQKPDHS
jgi:16S rRNA (adenine1518-N6/adenine1519-N6)-dimethyltransferase